MNRNGDSQLRPESAARLSSVDQIDRQKVLCVIKFADIVRWKEIRK